MNKEIKQRTKKKYLGYIYKKNQRRVKINL